MNRKRSWMKWGLAGLGALCAARMALRRMRHFDLSGKLVLVTGGSRGLGLVIARQLADKGARIVICSRDDRELRVALRDLMSRGAEAKAFHCDVSDRSHVNGMIRSINETMGPIDVLINNAGIIQVGPMDVMTIKDYEEAMKVHFWGPLYTTQAVIPEMVRRGAGRIANVSSIAGKVATPHLLPYSASKFALVGYSEGLRAELSRHGVMVTTVCPGMLMTGSPENAMFKGQHRLEYLWFSLGANSPVLAISAERAASQILSAIEGGDAEVVLGMPAQLMVKLHGLFPGMMIDAMAWLDRALPESGGIGVRRVRGRESHSALSPSLLTLPGNQAAARNNEITPPLIPP